MEGTEINDNKKIKCTSPTSRRDSKLIGKYYGYYHHVKIANN